MTDRPILFSAPMIRALLDGRKTQTRRVDSLKVINDDPSRYCFLGIVSGPGVPHFAFRDLRTGHQTLVKCRFPKGDRLWVRETLRRSNTDACHYVAGLEEVGMEKGDPRVADMIAWAHHKEGDTCVSIHMPRWASRLTLTVTDVRVERLQAISEDDAIAEGASSRPNCTGFQDRCDGWAMDWSRVGQPSKWADDGKTLQEKDIASVTARHAYGNLWDQINGAGSWDANPWIVALTFSVMEGNIDEAGDGCGARSAEPAPNPIPNPLRSNEP